MMDFVLNLQLFADGAGGDGGASGADGAAAPGATVQAVAAPVYELPASKRRPGMQRQAAAPAPAQDNAPTAGVQQDAPAQPAAPQEPARKNFDELVKGEYKADFDARVQEIVKQRLKASKGAEEKLGKYQSALQVLGERYGVDHNDPDALAKALDEDRAMYEDEAMREGVPVEQYMRTKKLEREVAAYQSQQQQAAQAARDEQEFGGLIQQAAELKATHPEFDLEQAMTTMPDLVRMVLKPPRGAGVPLKAAYIALNYDREQARVQQQIQQAMQSTAQTAQAAAAQAIAAGSRRPTENGAGGTAAASTKAGVPQNLTVEQIREYARRAQRGEQITFR